MSPNQKKYQDGYDDGNSDINWYDKKRFQDDDDYEKGVRDGWYEKQRRDEAAYEEKQRKIQEKYDNAVDYSSSTTSNNTYYVPVNNSSTTSSSNGLSCGMTIVAVFIALFIVFITAPFWGMLSGFIYTIAPIVVFFASLIIFAKLFSN